MGHRHHVAAISTVNCCSHLATRAVALALGPTLIVTVPSSDSSQANTLSHTAYMSGQIIFKPTVSVKSAMLKCQLPFFCEHITSNCKSTEMLQVAVWQLADSRLACAAMSSAYKDCQYSTDVGAVLTVIVLLSL